MWRLGLLDWNSLKDLKQLMIEPGRSTIQFKADGLGENENDDDE